MKVLIVGKGGREHALVWKLKQSSLVKSIFVCPGNAGTATLATNLNIGVNDFNAIAEACEVHQINMVAIGPEEPLVNGLVDFLQENPKTAAINIIGPDLHAAQLEGSKSFAKKFMEKYNIPTAKYKEFDKNSYEEGLYYLKNHSLPIVLKADGLAGGKGVIICENHLQAVAEFEMMLKFSKFGEAGYKVVVEEFLNGIEFSVFVLTDGKNYKILPMAKDYKRIGEGDSGLNTGGMGAVSPVPFVDDILYKKVEEKIIKPTILGLQNENMNYKGFVFIGLIKVGDEPYVIEYNCRLGDPETEVVLPRLNNDLADIFVKLYEGKLNDIEIEESPMYALTVVAASGGYPAYYETGYPISNIDKCTESIVFVAGADIEGDAIVTTGGRVLAITSMGNNVNEAASKSNSSLKIIGFEDMYYRKDIGYDL